MNDKEAFEKWFAQNPVNKFEAEEAWQAACEYKQKDIDELRDRLHHEVEMIDGAAKDHIAKLQAENERLKEVISYLPKVPTQPYEKKLSQRIQKLEAENQKLKECVGFLHLIDYQANIVEEAEDFFTMGDRVHSSYFENESLIKRARQVLKELEDK